MSEWPNDKKIFDSRWAKSFFLALSLFFFLMIFIDQYAEYSIRHRDRLEYNKNYLEGTAFTLTQLVDVDKVKKIKSPRESYYQELRKTLNLTGKNLKNIRNVYILVPTADKDKMQFLLDASEEKDENGNGIIDTNEETAGFLESYSIAKLPRLQEAVAKKKVTSDDYLSSDKWGTYLSGYSPLIDSQGKLVGLLGVDMTVGTINYYSRNIVIVVVIKFVIMLILTIIFLLDLYRGFKLLISNIQKQRDKLIQQKEEITNWNKDLEKKVTQRTAAVRNLLNNAGQGFLSLGENLIINEEYSLECQRIFQEEISGQRFFFLLFPCDIEQQEFLESICAATLEEEDEEKRNVYLSLLPEEIVIKQRNIQLEYKLLERETEKSFMIILTDITDKRSLENQVLEERNMLRMVIKFITEQDNFREAIASYRNFCQDRMERILENGRPLAEILLEILRDVHTFKGIFAQLEMRNLAKRMHQLETEINQFCQQICNKSLDSLKNFLLELGMEEWLAEDLAILKKVLGEKVSLEEKVLIIETRKIIELERKIISTFPPEECRRILPEFRRLRYKPFKGLLNHYPQYVKRVAEELGKRLYPLSIEGGDILIDWEEYQDFTKSLVHVFHNILDHGLEDGEERIVRGKDEYGKIRCIINEETGYLTLTIKDDGRGIDWIRIKEKAMAKGLIAGGDSNLNEQEIIDLIFLDGFSTSEKVTEISGRGVGMAIVKAELEKIGGRVEIQTRKDMGTAFRFLLPLAGTANIPEISLSEISLPLLEKIRLFMLEETGTEVQRVHPLEKKEKLFLQDLSAILALRGIWSGKIVISVEKRLGEKILESLTLENLSAEEKQIYLEEALAEMLNIIVGNSLKMINHWEDNVLIHPLVTTISAEKASLNYLGQEIWQIELAFLEGNLTLSFVLESAN